MEKYKLGVWDDVYTLLCMNNQQGPTVQHRKICSTFCINLYGKKCEKEEYMYLYNYITLLYTCETNTTLKKSYTPAQNLKNCIISGQWHIIYC